MSRIGKQPIVVPDKVKVTLRERTVNVHGPNGSLEHRVPTGVNVTMDEANKHILVTRVSDAKPHRQLHGLTRTLIANMIVGVTEGYKKELELHGVGYSVNLTPKGLSVELGLANTPCLPVPEGVAVEVLQPTNPGRLVVSGSDKCAVGEFAARVRALRPPEPYLGKGFRYTGETIRRKAGKAFAGTGA